MFFDTLRGKTVAFIGAGVSHRELIPMFAKAGAQVCLCDKRPREDFGQYAGELSALGVELFLGEDYLSGIFGKQIIMRTPGFEYFTPELQQAKKQGAHITSEIELFFEHCCCRTLAITGSDGKTTTTSLVAAMYEAAGRTVHLGGNIGRALLPIVDSISQGDIAVVELSSFQLISMSTSPDIAVVTNITPNHLDHHKDMQEYVDAKRNILLHQGENSVAVLGYENEISRSLHADVKGECRYFSRLRSVDSGAFLDENGMLCIAKEGEAKSVVHKSRVALRGEHNIENLLAAFAAVRDEIPCECMTKVAETFTGVEHRIEPVRTLNGVQWFNDAIATSPTRMVAGLCAFEQKLVVIAGGYDKKVPYEPIAQQVLKSVRLLILTGQTAKDIKKAITQHEDYAQSGIEIIMAEDLAHAVSLAQEHTKAGDIVTLSPASASFDAYPNFEAKGRHYKQLVMAL